MNETQATQPTQTQQSVADLSEDEIQTIVSLSFITVP